MKAITIFPEWCFAITNLGKSIENRRWDPTRRGMHIGERFAIHAGKTVGGRPGIDVQREALRGLMYMAERSGWIVDCYRSFSDNGVTAVFLRHIPEGRVELSFNAIPRSSVVAVATLADVRRDSPSSWAVDGQYHWGLADVVVLPEPVPCRGNQMLWTLPADVEIAVHRQINAVTVHGEEAF